MTLYEFLEQVVIQGGDVLSFKFEAGRDVHHSSVEFIEERLEERRLQLSRRILDRTVMLRDIHFGFDRRSYLGELEVSAIGKYRPFSGACTLILSEADE